MQGKEEAPDALHSGEEDENKEAGIQSRLVQCKPGIDAYRQIPSDSVCVCLFLSLSGSCLSVSFFVWFMLC